MLSGRLGFTELTVIGRKVCSMRDACATLFFFSPSSRCAELVKRLIALLMHLSPTAGIFVTCLCKRCFESERANLSFIWLGHYSLHICNNVSCGMVMERDCLLRSRSNKMLLLGTRCVSLFFFCYYNFIFLV